MREIKEGTILVAKAPCKMVYSGEEALIIGKEYPIKKIGTIGLIIKSEVDDNHSFTLDEDDSSYYGDCFDVLKY